MKLLEHSKEGWNSIVIVDTSAIIYNLNYLRKHSGDVLLQMAVVKANAYGHGAVDVAKAVNEQVEWFGVSSVLEGVELRDAGILKPIMVFGTPFRESAHFYSDFDLVAVVSQFHHFELLKSGTSYHLKFDTGMGRIGFRPEELYQVLENVDSYNNLSLGGIMTHFASAEEVDQPVFSEQMQNFDLIGSSFGKSIIRHVANSAASLHQSDIGLDMIRSGVAMYGFDPRGTYNNALKPALSWISRLAQVRFMKKGEGVSYSHSFHMPEDGFIGVIPVGYADGLPRRLRNRLRLKIGDKTYPVVGNITMDQIMVYLGTEPLEAGSEVLIMGGTEDQSVYRWAELMGTIPYEVTSVIGNRVKRVHR